MVDDIQKGNLQDASITAYEAFGVLCLDSRDGCEKEGSPSIGLSSACVWRRVSSRRPRRLKLELQ
jgi:hypothetical protein